MPKFKFANVQTIDVSTTDVTWHVTWPMVTWTLLISVPNEVPFRVNTVLGVASDEGNTDVTEGVNVESNVKLQFVLHTAATPLTNVRISNVPDWCSCVVNVILV